MFEWRSRNMFITSIIPVLSGLIAISLLSTEVDGCSKLEVTDSSGLYRHEGTYRKIDRADCGTDDHDTYELDGYYTYYIYYLDTYEAWALSSTLCSTYVVGQFFTTDTNPDGLWQSVDWFGDWSYEGLDVKCDDDPTGGLGVGGIVAIVIFSIVAVAIIACVVYKCKKHKERSVSPTPRQVTVSSHTRTHTRTPAKPTVTTISGPAAPPYTAGPPPPYPPPMADPAYPPGAGPMYPPPPMTNPAYPPGQAYPPGPPPPM